MRNRYHRNYKLFSAYLDNKVSEQEKQLLKSHLDRCAFCREIIEEMALLGTILRSDTIPEPDRNLFESIISETETIARRASNRRRVFHLSAALGGLAVTGIAFFLFFRVLHRPLFYGENVEFAKRDGTKEAVFLEQKDSSPLLSGKEKKKSLEDKNHKTQEELPAFAMAPSSSMTSPVGGSIHEADALIGQKKLFSEEKEMDTSSVRELSCAESPSEKRKDKTEAIPLDSLKRDQQRALRGSSISLSLSDKEDGKNIVGTIPYGAVLIRSFEEWRRVCGEKDLPEIDWNSHIFLLLPLSSARAGYKIVAVVEKEDRLLVQYQILSSQTLPVRMDCPYQCEKIPRRALVELEEKKHTSDSPKD
ncbi:MAG: zf-HC2 domain-containing protein [Candidatus Ratteibacteria bacterium]